MLSNAVQPLLRRLQHRRRGVDRDHVLDERRQRGADLSGAAAEIADGPVLLREGRQRREVKAIAEQIVADAIPLAGRRGEELLRLGAPLGERRLQPPLILRRGRRRSDLLAHQQPQPPRRGIEILARHRVEVAGAFGARRHPAAVGQRLEVPADRGLRQLDDAAQLGHRQLVPIEQQQHPAARAVGQRDR